MKEKSGSVSVVAPSSTLTRAHTRGGGGALTSLEDGSLSKFCLFFSGIFMEKEVLLL